MKTSRNQRRILSAANQKQSVILALVPPREYADNPMLPENLIELWRSKRYLVQVFQDRPDLVRITVSQTEHNGESWADNIPWEELQTIKRQIGRGDQCAVEAYPRDVDVVNVANMRHLWLLASLPSIGWTRA